MQAVRNYRDGTITLEDGNARQLVIPVDVGELSFTEKEEAAVVDSRGTPNQFTRGKSESIPVSFKAHFTEYFSKDRTGVGADDVSIRDFLRGNYDGSNSVANCGPYVVKIIFDISSPCKTGVGDKDEVITFPTFHADEFAFSEGEDMNELSISGKNLEPVPTFVRTTV